MNYEKIKEEAKQRGCTIKDLIVLACQNDPFYVGTPAAVELSDWFTDIWEQFGYTDGVHLRRIHYRLVSQETPVHLPNGKPYVNTNNCWAMLDLASKYARYMGKVDSRCFDDRRNGRPVLNMEALDAEPEAYVHDPANDFSFKIPSFPSYPRFEICGYEVDQRYHLEVWAEKSTMNDVLEPLCSHWEANLITGIGELSITSVVWLIDRMKELKKPCRIFYISDFDPAGQSMPVAVARKIEKFIHDSDMEFDIRLFPLVLSFGQCNKYRLPRTPIKGSELRAGKFEERFGGGATELDALEALYPGELKKIIGGAISNYRDKSLGGRVAQAETTAICMLQDIWQYTIENYREELSEIEVEYEAIKREYDGRISDLSERIKYIWQDISDDLENAGYDVALPSLPEAEQAEEIGEGLYNSNRDYFEQLKVYKTFQGKL